MVVSSEIDSFYPEKPKAISEAALSKLKTMAFTQGTVIIRHPDEPTLTAAKESLRVYSKPQRCPHNNEQRITPDQVKSTEGY